METFAVNKAGVKGVVEVSYRLEITKSRIIFDMKAGFKSANPTSKEVLNWLQTYKTS